MTIHTLTRGATAALLLAALPLQGLAQQAAPAAQTPAATTPAPAPAFTLEPLPYRYDALEPVIDARTMQIHHDRHHRSYVGNLNKAIDADPSLRGLTLEEYFATRDPVSGTAYYLALLLLALMPLIVGHRPSPAGRG